MLRTLRVGKSKSIDAIKMRLVVVASLLFCGAIVFPQQLFSGHAPQCLRLDKSPGQDPEHQFNQITAALADEELALRLIFAESLAASCPKEFAVIAQWIASVIVNRKEGKKNYRQVVFQPLQFRSTFGSCDVAQRQAFLCPTSIKDDWQKKWKTVERAFQRAKLDQYISNGVKHYFLPSHFHRSHNCKRWRGKWPDWTKTYNEVKETGVSRNCVRLYKKING